MGFVLEEIALDKSCFPYDSFGTHRFGVPHEAEASEAVEELIKESQLEPV